MCARRWFGYKNLVCDLSIFALYWVLGVLACLWAPRNEPTRHAHVGFKNWLYLICFCFGGEYCCCCCCWLSEWRWITVAGACARGSAATYSPSNRVFILGKMIVNTNNIYDFFSLSSLSLSLFFFEFFTTELAFYEMGFQVFWWPGIEHNRQAHCSDRQRASNTSQPATIRENWVR